MFSKCLSVLLIGLLYAHQYSSYQLYVKSPYSHTDRRLIWDSPRHQQPSEAPSSFQPRPVPGSEFHFHTPEEDQSKTIRPKQPTAYDLHSSLRPAEDTSRTDAAINSIFDTENFLSPSVNQDPKSEGVIIEPEVKHRGLFDINAICRNGMELKAGRCRKSEYLQT